MAFRPAPRILILSAVVLAAIAGAAAFLQFGAAHRLPKSTPVLLITVDTLRPDALGWVSGKNATPNIDALVSRGVAFDSAVSSTPLTLPSHASIMSGRYPARHGVRDNGQVLPASVELLAVRLQEAGYVTGAFVSAYVLRAMFGLDRGFDLYNDELTSGSEGWLDRPASQTIDSALPWIRKQENKPWFAWIHLYDPHTPYAPPAEFAGDDEHSNYNGEVRYVDRELGRLLDEISKLDIQPLIILTADHGEAFGEHGEVEHGLFVYDTTTLSPLVFSQEALPVARLKNRPRLVDIAPTVLELLGQPALEGTDGVSLASLLFGGAQTIPPAYSETFHPWTTYGWSPLASLHENDWKAIDGPEPELFQTAVDPGELDNLANAEVARTDRMTLAIATLMSPKDKLDATRIEDNATMQKLASLGYLGNASTSTVPTSGLPNPRNMLAERAILRNAEFLLRSEQLEAALEAFNKVLQTDPQNRFATLRSGISLLKLNRFPEAVERLRASLKLDPDQAETHYALADALSRSGRFDEAVQQWLETVRLQPRRAAAWGNLALVLSRLGRDVEAMKAVKTALEIEPGNVQLLQNLALQQRKTGDKSAMIETLEKAAASGGGQFLYAALLGLELFDQGRVADAEPWLLKVKPPDTNYPEACYRLAQIRLGQDRIQEARELLRQAVRGNPGLIGPAKADPALARLLPGSNALE